MSDCKDCLIRDLEERVEDLEGRRNFMKLESDNLHETILFLRKELGGRAKEHEY